MDFFKKHVSETLDAINNLLDMGVKTFNVRRIRRINDVKPTDRSTINFIWRTLKMLEKNGVLEKIGKNSPASYKIIVSEKINTEKVASELAKNRNALKRIQTRPKNTNLR